MPRRSSGSTPSEPRPSDVVDGLDLDAALSAIAAQLAEHGDTDSLDARRAKALGVLARGEWQTGQPATTPRDGPHRQVTLQVRLTEDALHGYGDGIATLATAAGHPLGQVTVEQVQE